MIKHRGFFLLNMEKGFHFFAYFDPYEAPNFESDFTNYILTDPDVKRVDLEKKRFENGKQYYKMEINKQFTVSVI